MKIPAKGVPGALLQIARARVPVETEAWHSLPSLPKAASAKLLLRAIPTRSHYAKGAMSNPGLRQDYRALWRETYYIV